MSTESPKEGTRAAADPTEAGHAALDEETAVHVQVVALDLRAELGLATGDRGLGLTNDMWPQTTFIGYASSSSW
jgi:hypothetical protein